MCKEEGGAALARARGFSANHGTKGSLMNVESMSPSTNDTPPTYKVERVIKYDNGRYLIKWKGYPASKNTWEPPGNLLNHGEEMEEAGAETKRGKDEKEEKEKKKKNEEDKKEGGKDEQKL